MKPRAVNKWLADFEDTEDGLREYLGQQQAFFDSLPEKHTDFTGWLSLKLSCNRRDAQIIYRWAMKGKNDPQTY